MELIPVHLDIGSDAGTGPTTSRRRSASAIAEALGAAKLPLPDDVPGLLRRRRRPSTLIPEIARISEARRLIEEGRSRVA